MQGCQCTNLVVLPNGTNTQTKNTLNGTTLPLSTKLSTTTVPLSTALNPQTSTLNPKPKLPYHCLCYTVVQTRN